MGADGASTWKNPDAKDCHLTIAAGVGANLVF